MLSMDGMAFFLYTHSPNKRPLRKMQRRRNPSPCACLTRAPLRMQQCSDFQEVERFVAGVGLWSARIYPVDAGGLAGLAFLAAWSLFWD